MSMRLRVFWPVIVAAAALVGLLAYGITSKRTDTSIDQAVLNGERVAAPTAELPVLGKPAQSGSAADYRGKVVVMNFWASWCKPCRDELPLLERTQKQIAPQGGTVLGISYRDITADALVYVRRYDLTFPSLRDRDGRFADEYSAQAFPETFVIDRKGEIAAARRGPVTQAWLDETLPPLLEEQA